VKPLTKCTIRKFRVSDIYGLHIMYNSLSEKSKLFFHPGFLGFESISPAWFVTQLALIASSFTAFKKLLLRTYPSTVFSSLISTNELGEIIGFAFLKLNNGPTKKNSFGVLGMCVRDDYQGKRIGSKLNERLLSLGRNENVEKICLITLTENIRAQHVYEKYGFKKIRVLFKNDVWRGQLLDSVEMCLSLN
jgi:RimJ/RimL family protein N-acetyltransferase